MRLFQEEEVSYAFSLEAARRAEVLRKSRKQQLIISDTPMFHTSVCYFKECNKPLSATEIQGYIFIGYV